MEKSKKIKLFIGLFYITLISLFLFFIFSKFTLQEITSYEFIKNNRNYFFELKETNYIKLIFAFIIFCTFWVLAAGFLSPIAIFAGFIFGKWIGILLLVISTAIGATGLYIFANYFLKDLIKKKFLSRFQNLEKKFKKSELLYLLIYRFIGGIPFAISNVLPCIFNVKTFNFFFATLIGIIPQLFLVVSIGSGLEKIIDQNLEKPKITQLIKSPDIYIPLIAFFLLVFITVIVRKFFYKN